MLLVWADVVWRAVLYGSLYWQPVLPFWLYLVWRLLLQFWQLYQQPMRSIWVSAMRQYLLLQWFHVLWESMLRRWPVLQQWGLLHLWAMGLWR
jgi:hypothetical protein